MSIKSIRFASRNAFFAGAAGLFALFGGTGCYATVQTRPGMVAYDDGATVWVDDAPASIETYPCEYYAGTPMYLVDGRWYYRSSNRWAYYRTAPVELERRRVVIERSWHRPVVAYTPPRVAAQASVAVHVGAGVHAHPGPQPRVVAQPRVAAQPHPVRRAPARPRARAQR